MNQRLYLAMSVTNVAAGEQGLREQVQGLPAFADSQVCLAQVVQYAADAVRVIGCFAEGEGIAEVVESLLVLAHFEVGLTEGVKGGPCRAYIANLLAQAERLHRPGEGLIVRTEPEMDDPQVVHARALTLLVAEFPLNNESALGEAPCLFDTADVEARGAEVVEQPCQPGPVATARRAADGRTITGYPVGPWFTQHKITPRDRGNLPGDPILAQLSG